MDLATGYAVQRLLRDGRGTQVGWKLGVTSRAKQQQVNVDEPIRGFLAERAHARHRASRSSSAAHIQPRCEPEIVFVLGRDLQGASVTSSQVLDATRRGGGWDRGARLAVRRLPVHDAGRGGGQHIGGAVRDRSGRAGRGAGPSPGGRRARAPWRGGGHRGRRRRARPPGGRGRLAGPVAGRPTARGSGPATSCCPAGSPPPSRSLRATSWSPPSTGLVSSSWPADDAGRRWVRPTAGRPGR